jgi:uncharacterized protein (DUF2141 family)
LYKYWEIDAEYTLYVCVQLAGVKLTNQKRMITLKNLFLIMIFLSVMPLTSFGQFSLTIEFDGLRNSNGQILFEFMNENGIKIMGITKKIEDKKCIIVIENLKPGKYAFKYFHDENNNEKLDLNWARIPKERYGFSNNAKGSFGPPSFEKTIFVLEENTTLKCTPTYLKF